MRLAGSQLRGPGALGPWQGFGDRVPEVLPLTLTLGRRIKSQSGAEPNAQLSSPSEEVFRAAPRNVPKSQHPARFRKLGKPRFPNLRREADALHPRWEAKRSRALPLTQKAGADGKAKGLTVSSILTASGSLLEGSGPPRFGRPVRLSGGV